MAEFVYFKSDNFDYIREAASSIDKVFPTGKLILVVRGHSGSILAGGIAYILKRKDRDVLISVSRKWAYIRYDPKLDWIEKEGETLHMILWYNKHYWSGEVERKYIILF